MGTVRWNVSVSSIRQLDEIHGASRYPKFKQVLQPARAGSLINNMRRAFVLERLDIKDEIKDSDDAFLPATASMSAADYLVTGDKHAGLLRLRHTGRTRIITPSVFHSEVL
ncbi:MAG: hypothetical protein LBS53_13195 [Synergistaceae bacterium]|jgi:predicted nucleic acid-binding protein|nr:hypothetical protein [Synergistaceae bacterium]